MKTIYDQHEWSFFLYNNKRIKLVCEDIKIKGKQMVIHYFLKRLGPFSIIGAPLFATTTGPMNIVLDHPELKFEDYIQIINQIIAKQKAKEKLPTWFAAQNIIYPSKISVEQTSSEKTAAYKASLVSGDSLIDLTGGFGVDDYYFSMTVKTITHCEINTELSNIVAHNFKELGRNNITCV